MVNKNRKLVFALIAVIACLAVLEILVKISGVNKDFRRQAEAFKRNPLDFQAVMQVHRYEPKKAGRLPGRMPENYLTQAYDPDLFWTVKPHSDYYPDRYISWFKQTKIGSSERKEKINALGFRDREIPPRKLKDEVRIFCMGDSCTFGLGVYRDETFPARLQNLMSETPPDFPVSVYNAGTPGYTSYQGLALFRKKILPLAPDIVIISYGINDNATHRNISDRDFARLLMETPMKRFQNNVLARSEIYLGLKQLILYRRYRAKSDHEEKNPRVSLPEFRSNYMELVGLIRDSGGKTLIVRAALAGRATTPYLEALRNIAKHSGALYFDGKEYFEKAFSLQKTDRPDLAYNDLFIDALHPSAPGHRIIAEGLMTTLVLEGIIPPAHGVSRHPASD